MPYPPRKTESYANLGGLNKKASQYITGDREALELLNYCFTVPGALLSRPGTTQYIGATVIGRISGLYEYNKLNGASWITFTANTNAYQIVGGAPISFRTGLLSGALTDFVTFVDYLFIANGQDFFKYNGTVATNFSLPPGAAPTIGPGPTGTTLVLAPATYNYSVGFLNDRGYYGPSGDGVGAIVGATGSVILTGFSVPIGYGITGIVIYRDGFEIGEMPATSATFLDAGASLMSRAENFNLWFTLAPRYIELYNNQLFLAGFSSILSTVYFSDIGEPEAIGNTAFFEIRTNDGDRVTGLKTYYSQLMAFKERSFHYIKGDSPSNLQLVELSAQYGCISNRATAVFNSKCWFLDTKGIVEYDGGQIGIVSTRIEPTFLRMHQAAARDNAIMLHVKSRNEIWTAFPIDGATFNNYLVVYDYNAESFAEWFGFVPSSLNIATGRFMQSEVFYGDYSGTIHNFGASLFSDNGRGFACVLGTRFLGDEMGFSVEKQYRQLYLDVTPIASGATRPITINLRTNESAATVLTRTMYGATFQSRIDFGLPAKSMAFQAVYISQDSPLQLNGFTIAYRYQRNT